MRHRGSVTRRLVLALCPLWATAAAAQVPESPNDQAPAAALVVTSSLLDSAAASVALLQTPGGAARQTPGGAARPDDPWSNRPACSSMFLKADWHLTSRQQACNWLQNGVLSTGRIFTTAASTMFSMVTDRPSERGDGFRVRFGRKWVQGAVATTGEYVGTLIAREDPREIPPYLVMRPSGPPRGFFARFGSAIGRTVVTTECKHVNSANKQDPLNGKCLSEKDIHRRFALSRVLGAVGSGGAGAALNWNEPNRGERAWRGMLSAYASAFGHQLASEFKPEAAKLGGRVFRLLGGS